MDYQTHTLSNGLRVIHRHNRHDVVYCGYAIHAGTRHEALGEEGLAHFCEHVTFKGTTHRKAWHILNRLESVGGDLNAFTNKEDTVYYAAIQSEHTERAIELLTDIVMNSVYPQHEIDKEVEVICEEIDSYLDNPAEQIYDDFEHLIFKGHPLGHNILGQSERVRNFTSADAQRFTHRFYRPDNMVFFIDGNVNFTRVVKTLEKSMADTTVPRENEPLEMLHATNPLPPYQACHEIMPQHAHQTHVMIGTRAFHAEHPMRTTLLLLNNILGGPGMNSRLNLALREHHGLVYAVESTVTAYSDTGIWALYFGCDPKEVERCMRLVRHELDNMMLQTLTDTKLTAAKRQLKGQTAIACDQRDNFAIGFGRAYLHHGWEQDPDDLYRRIDAVTADDVSHVARLLLDEQQLSVVRIG